MLTEYRVVVGAGLIRCKDGLNYGENNHHSVINTLFKNKAFCVLKTLYTILYKIQIK
jgi:hypothetical protein